MHQIKHIAIIMDGNGRWAQSRRISRPRVWGHVRGASVVSNIVEAADELGVKHLTLFAFSTENWSRPLQEVRSLFTLLKKYIQRERSRIIKNNIRFTVVGDLSKMPMETQSLVNDLEEISSKNDGLNLTFAFDYGGRAEIITAVNAIMKEPNRQGPVTESELREHLYLKEDVDLLIRTGGDQRISNFLLWQAAYAELYFTPTMWPEFSVNEFVRIFNSSRERERRFGGVEKEGNLDEVAKKVQKNKMLYLSERNLS